MITIQDIIKQAKKDKALDEERYGKHSPYDLDWFIDRVIRHLPDKEFAALFTTLIDLEQFITYRLSNGYTIRRAFMHDEVLDKVLDTLPQEK